MPSRSDIAGFDNPSAISRRTSRSRALKLLSILWGRRTAPKTRRETRGDSTLLPWATLRTAATNAPGAIPAE